MVPAGREQGDMKAKWELFFMTKCSYRMYLLPESNYQNVLTKLVPWKQCLYFCGWPSKCRIKTFALKIRNTSAKAKNAKVAYNLLTDALGVVFSHSEQSVAHLWYWHGLHPAVSFVLEMSVSSFSAPPVRSNIKSWDAWSHLIGYHSK